MVNTCHTATLGKLVLFEGPGKDFKMKEVPVRPLRPGEILVKNVYTTICGSDIHTYCGLRKEASPTVLGHEIVGQIVEIGPAHPGVDLRNEPLSPGDYITWSIFSSDPLSANSLAGIPQKGDNIFKYGHGLAKAPEVFHGGLAEYCILIENTAVIKLPDELPFDVAASLNCSVSTVAGALRLAGDMKGKTVLITGMGHLGITFAAMCREAGAAWLGAADISQKRLENVLDFGVTKTFNLETGTDAIAAQLRANLPKKGVDIVFDMSGSPDAMEFGLNVLAIAGTAVWIGAVFNTRKIQVDAEKIIRGLVTIKGLHNYNLDDFAAAMDFMEKNWDKYPFKDAVEMEFPLEQAQEAFEYAVKYKPFRVGVRI